MCRTCSTPVNPLYVVVRRTAAGWLTSSITHRTGAEQDIANMLPMCKVKLRNFRWHATKRSALVGVTEGCARKAGSGAPGGWVRKEGCDTRHVPVLLCAGAISATEMPQELAHTGMA
jgi:hypothetical protein